MRERLTNLGYFGMIKEATKGVPLAPTDWVPLYESTLNTNGNLIDQQPIYGQKAATYNTIQGQRSHRGDVTVLAEPNTTARLADMLLTRLSTSGSGPSYTHVFGSSNTVNPNSYTVDISDGDTVARYFGVEASKMSPVWNKNELQWKLALSALGSFQSRKIATVSTITLTLSTDYDPAPTKGLVVGDLVRIYKSSDGSVLNTTVATVNVDGVTITLAASAGAFAAGDSIQLRAAAPSLTLLPTFLWAKNFWQFGVDASTALSNTQTRIEQGSTFDMIHSFESDDGADRSGGFDPERLVRTTTDVAVNVKKAFDTNEDIIAFNTLSKSALQMRFLAGTTNQYEARLTFNHLKTDGKIAPDLKPGQIAYSNLKMHPIYDSTDAVQYTFTVTNQLATI